MYDVSKIMKNSKKEVLKQKIQKANSFPVLPSRDPELRWLNPDMGM